MKIEKTRFLAITNKEGKIFFIGSNGKFIKSENLNIISNLPFIFGNLDKKEFLKFKEIIDSSEQWARHEVQHSPINS